MSDAFIDVADFIPALSPRFASPLHLGPVLDLFRRIARGESVKAVVSVPPRFGKTETLMHAIVWLLLQRPEFQIIYASYAQRIAEKKSRKIRELARKAGVPLANDSQSRADWRTNVDDGGLWATAIEGSVTGEGAHVLVCDDLVKGRAEAESAASRERAHGWLLSDALTRLEPDGSVVVNGTRWHPEDPVGHAIGLGWEVVNLTAITEDGASLWPERWPLERLLEIRETLGGPDGYEWQSLYQGNPRGRGSRVFGDVLFYDTLPAKMRFSVGLDFAYSTRKTSDYSVAVLLGHDDVHAYVIDVIRVREEPADFRARVRTLLDRQHASVTAYIGGTEAGIVAFLGDGGVHVDARPASADKFTRAIPVAAAWNTGKVLLPRSAPWLNDFVSEVCGFTGVKDRHDDCVDSLAAAFDAVSLGHQTGLAESVEAMRGARAMSRWDSILEAERDEARAYGPVQDSRFDGGWFDY